MNKISSVRNCDINSDESVGCAVKLLWQQVSFTFPIYVTNKEQWATLDELHRRHSDLVVGRQYQYLL